MDKLACFVAGVQKGGTTALFSYLAQFPDIAAPDAKETHFFDNESVDWAAPDYGLLHRRFPPADGRMRFDATPIYTYWPNCLERIRAYNPAARIIVLFRDPIERAFSHWRMEWARAAETLPFPTAIREGRTRMNGAPHRVYSYVERGFYRTQVARLLRLFPPGQCLLLRSADLSEHPRETLAAIARFLDVSTPTLAPRRVFEAQPADYPSESVTLSDTLYLRGLFTAEQFEPAPPC